MEVEEAAVVGPLAYPTLYGHFFNEALVVYHALDAVLPPDVPIVWGHSGFQMSVVQQLRALDGVFRAGRPELFVPPDAPTLLRAKRLFFIRPTNRTFRDMPPQTASTQRLLNAALGRAVRLHFNR